MTKELEELHLYKFKSGAALIESFGVALIKTYEFGYHMAIISAKRVY